MIVVVTAAIGTTETPPPPKFPNPMIRYVCATDRNDVNGWERWPTSARNPRRSARDVKLSAVEQFPDDVVVWVDASFDWIDSPAKPVLYAGLLGCDIAAFAHPDRNRINDEACEVIRCGLAPPKDVMLQMDAYQADGFDVEWTPQTVLTTTGLMVFTRSEKIPEFMQMWRKQIDEHTVRDQLSVDYSAWKTGTTIGHLPGHYRDNPFVRYNRERHRARRAA